jgi:hypothetical protein
MCCAHIMRIALVKGCFYEKRKLGQVLVLSALPKAYIKLSNLIAAQ